jgi:hypothetical protein
MDNGGGRNIMMEASLLQSKFAPYVKNFKKKAEKIVFSVDRTVSYLY